MSSAATRIEAPRIAPVHGAATFQVRDWVRFVKRHQDHKPGSNLTVGMSGRVVRVIPADKVHNPHPGETGRIEVEFASPIGGAFTEWLWSSEARFVSRA